MSICQLWCQLKINLKSDLVACKMCFLDEKKEKIGTASEFY